MSCLNVYITETGGRVTGTGGQKLWHDAHRGLVGWGERVKRGTVRLLEMKGYAFRVWIENRETYKKSLFVFLHLLLYHDCQPSGKAQC